MVPPVSLSPQAGAKASGLPEPHVPEEPVVTEDREGGYIKLYRRWSSSPAVLALDGAQRSVWIEILFAANWKDTVVVLRSGPTTIKRGQALIPERTLAKRAGVGRQVVRTTLDRLVLSETLKVTQARSLNGPSITLITVLNYDRFQANEELPTQGKTQSQPKPNPSSTRSEEVEEVEEERQLLAPVGAAPGSFRTLQGLLVKAFEDERGSRYLWQGAKDAQGLKRLLALRLPNQDIVDRWRAGLKAAGWKSASTVAQLAAKWNDLASEVNGHDVESRRLREATERSLEEPGRGEAGGDRAAGKGAPDSRRLPETGKAMQSAIGKLLGVGWAPGDVQDNPPVEPRPQRGPPAATGPVRLP